MREARFARGGRVATALAALALVLTACGETPNAPRQAEAPNDGVQLSGRVGGAQLSVSFGDPDFQLTDCDPQDGIDRDWCLTARSIDGARVDLIFENPTALAAGETYDVIFDRCTDCDDVTGGAVIDLAVSGERRRAVGGQLRVIEVSPRYAASFTLRFDDGGTISGEFNVRPLGAIVPAENQTPFDSTN